MVGCVVPVFFAWGRVGPKGHKEPVKKKKYLFLFDKVA